MTGGDAILIAVLGLVLLGAFAWGMRWVIWGDMS